MKIAVVAHPERPEASNVEAVLRAEATRHNMEVVPPGAAEIVISVGGDGTLLRAIREAGPATPVVGIDVGHVGYLAEVEPHHAPHLMERLAAGDYRVVERMTVQAELPDGVVVTGLNDVVFEKVMSQHAVRLACRIDGDHLVTYRADGLIVATPTGSTAYAYSAGGPVLDPEVQALVLVPVAPHNLFSRAVVVAPDSTVELEVVAGRPVRVNVDGQDRGVVEPGSKVAVRRGDQPALLATVDHGGFASRVATNLGIPSE